MNAGDVWDGYVDWLREYVAPPIKYCLQPIDDLLIALPPWCWTVCAVGFLALGGVFAFLFKRETIYLGAPDQARWRDLRIWAVLFLVPFVLIYLLFMD